MQNYWSEYLKMLDTIDWEYNFHRRDSSMIRGTSKAKRLLGTVKANKDFFAEGRLRSRMKTADFKKSLTRAK